MSHNSKIKKDEMEHNHNIRKKRLSTISGGIFSVDNTKDTAYITDSQ